jgi:hypothetical protein
MNWRSHLQYQNKNKTTQKQRHTAHIMPGRVRPETYNHTAQQVFGRTLTVCESSLRIPVRTIQIAISKL